MDPGREKGLSIAVSKVRSSSLTLKRKYLVVSSWGFHLDFKADETFRTLRKRWVIVKKLLNKTA